MTPLLGGLFLSSLAPQLVDPGIYVIPYVSTEIFPSDLWKGMAE